MLIVNIYLTFFIVTRMLVCEGIKSTLNIIILFNARMFIITRFLRSFEVVFQIIKYEKEKKIIVTIHFIRS